jgi:transcriptional regulator with XRE-family HTH domain
MINSLDMPKTIHQGRNVKRFREMLGIKQDALAFDLGEHWTQKKVSMLEQKEIIEPALLQQIADVLKVPVEAIKNFDEEKAINIISNNSFENCDQPASIFYNATLNPIEKWLEAMEENKKLYEALLKSEREKVSLLEKLLDKATNTTS